MPEAQHFRTIRLPVAIQHAGRIVLESDARSIALSRFLCLIYITICFYISILDFEFSIF